ncbi:MAG: magnesium chelatase ATPase subunit D [Gloeomargarita sp. SKYBB_i_bin120]|nr:magnesium chelatase ATPase subunit D [Gloeomargarita sp. SKYG98]MCS7292276.1 magnesium chelatase ATPase subunit D [Gloeomargarita sp. SKYB120]MDW8177837.1 magnesium chelatase ATPase subunit D [Gloeomargarita sp. SKYBB_i_bin120]
MATVPAEVPFTRIVGLETARQALLLLAVNPLLAGAAIAAKAGSGKSTLVRALAALLPEGTPFVELPLNITEDRLIGGLDLEATLIKGVPVLAAGVLAQAHGGVLYLDNANRLEPSLTATLAEVLSSGVVRVEREGLSTVQPARFVLIATYDPAEGDLPVTLLDRLGLLAPLLNQGDARLRAEVVRRHFHPCGAVEETTLLRGMLQAARERLPQVQISDDQTRALLQTALALGVEGNRADLFAVQAALTSAALAGRETVEETDLQLAVRLVLLPRATQVPTEDTPAPTPPTAPRPSQASDSHQAEPDDAPATSERPLQELLLEAVQTALPPNLLDLPFAAQRRGRRGSRGQTLNARRGRFVRAVSGDTGRIALLPTLMAAAPWQRLRQSQGHTRICVRRDDLRVKRYRDKAGTLYIFAVDASGSMAINRMREAKGAAIHLLQNAYVHRDQVALLAFRGQSAQVLLPPSQSVERARRELDVLPTGGGTPLAAALLTAWQLAHQARQRGIANITLVLMTDGRANVGLQAPAGDRQRLQAEVQRLAQQLQADGVQAIVLDTQVNYLSRSEAAQLAQWLGGRYVYLPNARAEQIAQTLTATNVPS